MVRKLFHSFVPYVLLLIGIFVAVLILDLYAEQISEQPVMIQISSESASDSEDIRSYELNEGTENESLAGLLEDTLFLKGQALYKQKHYKKADRVFESLESQHPGNKSLINYLGLSALKQNEFRKAQEYFFVIVGIDSSYFTGYINLALSCTKLNQNQKAEQYYRKALEIDPNNPKAHFNLGLLYSKLEKWEEAKSELNKSISLSSGTQKAKALCYLGISQIHTADTLSAIESLQSSIEYRPDYQLARIHLALITSHDLQREQELLKIYNLNPKSYYANYYLGTHYVEVKNHTKAEYYLRKALGYNPNDDLAIEALCSLLIDLARHDEASLVISGFSANDTLPQYYFQQGRNASKQGKTEEAISLYDIALSKSGGDYPEAYMNQAILFKRNGEVDKAIHNYKMAILGRSNYSAAYYNLAVLYKENGQLDEAIDMYQHSIEYNKSAYKSWYNLGAIYRDQYQSLLAIEAYRKAIEIKPDYLQALSTLGVLYSRQDEYELAISTYKVLLEKHPNYNKGWFNLGLAYNKSGQLNEAIQAYEKLLEIDPENTKALLNLGVLYARAKLLDKAINAFENASDVELDNPEIRFNLALQYEKAGRFEDAIYQLQKATQLNTTYRKAHNRLIDLYYNQEDSVMAYIATYNKLMVFQDAEQFYSLGKSLLEVDQLDYALSSLENAKALGKNGAWLDYWIGKAHMDKGNYNEAITNLVKSLANDPDHQFANYRLGQTYELLGDNTTADIYYRHLLRLRPDFKVQHKSKEN